MSSHRKLACGLLLAIHAAGAASAADYTITSTTTNWSVATWTPSMPASGGGVDYTIYSGKSGANYNYTNDLGAGSPKEFLLNSVVWAAGGPLFAGQWRREIPAPGR